MVPSSLTLQSIIVGLLVVLIVYKFIQRMKYKLPPGPFALPLIGNYEVLKARFVHEVFEKYKKKYGPVFQVHFGPIRAVVLNDINVVTEALVKRKADFANRPQTATIFLFTDGGKDIAFANYTPTWKLHRKMAGKALRRYMAGLHLEEVVHESMKKSLNRMAEEKGPFNPEPYIDFMVFNILNSVCFGGSCELDDPDFQRFMYLDKEFVKLFGNGLVEDILPILIKIRPTEAYKRLVSMTDEILGMLKKKLKEHQDTFDPDNVRDFTDALILARKEVEDEENDEVLSQLTDTHLVQTISDIFFAGIDTSRMTLYFSVRYMAGLQDIQTKVQMELDTVIGKNRLPGLQDRENLAFCEATLYETMRLGTVAATGIPHSTMCDTTVGGYDIPKDTMVMINHWALHHDPSYWKDVNKFDPNRYLESNGKLSLKPESWLPFSMGRRVCLGETVAKPELHLIFSSIFQRFQISLAEGSDPEIKLTGGAGGIHPESFQITIKERI